MNISGILFLSQNSNSHSFCTVHCSMQICKLNACCYSDFVLTYKFIQIKDHTFSMQSCMFFSFFVFSIVHLHIDLYVLYFLPSCTVYEVRILMFVFTITVNTLSCASLVYFFLITAKWAEIQLSENILQPPVVRDVYLMNEMLQRIDSEPIMITSTLVHRENNRIFYGKAILHQLSTVSIFINPHLNAHSHTCTRDKSCVRKNV